jgi:hypothetical protein
MTRDAVRLQGRLVGSKRKRNENGDDVVPLTNGVASKSGDNDDSDEGESRVQAVSKKEKPKSVFDKFPIPVSNKKKQPQASTLVNGAAEAPQPLNPLSTPEPALSKARSPGATTNGVPILFPTASSKGTGPYRTPSPAQSTTISFGDSRTSRSIFKAARRSLKQKAIFQQGRLEIVDLETPAEHIGTPSVTTDPRSPSLPNPIYQVNKGKGKEKEAGVYASAHVPVIDLGIPKAKCKPHPPLPREDDPVISPTTPHPPRMRQSLPIGKSVLQLEPITPITEPNQELGSPKKRKRNRKHKKKKHKQRTEDGSTESGFSFNGQS